MTDLQIGKYQELEVIGKGSFGIVKKIKRISDSKIFVWKEIYFGRMCEKELELIVREVNILRELEHPYIVGYLERVLDTKHKRLFIVMEYCEGGDLHKMIQKHKKKNTFIKESKIWKIFTQIILALFECHRKRILHRDIKPDNIFLDNQKNIKLGDFGLARALNSDSQFAHTHVGTPFYMSPEQFAGNIHDDKTDIWSLGCLIYELACLSPPFEAFSLTELGKKISLGKFQNLPSFYSSELFDLISEMLQVDKNKRPSASEILAKITQINLQRNSFIFNTQIQTNQNPNNQLIQKENQLIQKENQLIQKENQLIQKENQLNQKEIELNQKEIYLKHLEVSLKKKEIEPEKKDLIPNQRIIRPILKKNSRFKKFPKLNQNNQNYPKNQIYQKNPIRIRKTIKENQTNQVINSRKVNLSRIQKIINQIKYEKNQKDLENL
ncbi:camk family protein kinase [Anaeramoeba ignava]|uniref:non-specific serine/threonine protein kinase n=1 Tax=Anaeramoeba ignava TaxID=1746090 RepID=A0A9Q0L7H9_ANAIG|nr:camk family protein kinase [Anaeramoeba ignava]